MVCARTRSMAVLVEARLGERETQQLESLVRMLHQGLQRTAERIVAGVEGELDGARRETLLERIGIVGARALVEQAGEHLRDARLVRRILRGSALEDEGDGDQRHHVGFDVPGLDTARRCQRLHIRGRRRQGFDRSGRHGDLSSCAGAQEADFCR